MMRRFAGARIAGERRSGAGGRRRFRISVSGMTQRAYDPDFVPLLPSLPTVQDFSSAAVSQRGAQEVTDALRRALAPR